MIVRDLRAMIAESIDLAIDDVSTAILGGDAADFAEYRELVGQVSGLKRAIVILDETFERLDLE